MGVDLSLVDFDLLCKEVMARCIGAVVVYDRIEGSGDDAGLVTHHLRKGSVFHAIALLELAESLLKRERDLLADQSFKSTHPEAND